MKTAMRVVRLSLIFGCVSGLVLESTAVAQKKLKPKANWNQPIPQDPKKQEQWARDRLAWQRKTLAGAYDRVGKKDPKWDQAARLALDEAAQHSCERGDLFNRRWAIVSACRQAMAAGCEDPLIVWLEADYSFGFVEPNSKDIIHRLLPAVDALERSPYPAIRKVRALAAAVKNAATFDVATPAEKQGASRHTELLLKWLPVSFAEEGANLQTEDDWLVAFRMLIDGRRAMTGDAEATFKWIEEQVQRMPELRVSWLQAKIRYLLKYAWEARGDGPGDTVTEEGSRKMNARLAEAKKSIDLAWSLKPGDGWTAYVALATQIGFDGNRAEMERWFRRAMEADGNNLDACEAKMYWLDPRWYGSVEEQVAFARLCGDTRNWQAQITLLEPESYLKATSSPDEPPGGDFWKSPDVWKRSKAIFDEYLLHYPDDKPQRSRYAVIAALTGHNAEATEQFDRLGDANLFYVTSWGMTLEWIRALRKDSATKVAEAAGRPDPTKPSPRRSP